MRKSFIPILAGALAVSGCAYGAQDPLGGLGGILGGVLGGGNSGGGYNNQDFERAAVSACGNEASRYGQVSINNVERRSNSTIRVYGSVQTNNGRRNFNCDFRSDGRITDFNI